MSRWARACLIGSVMVASSLMGVCPSAQASTSQFSSEWMNSVRGQALRAGISPETLEGALTQIRYLPDVIDRDRKQPEHTASFESYKRRIVSEQRIREGQAAYRKYASLLKEIEAEYGVPAPVIVALWGIESSYGKNKGDFEILSSLATLAHWYQTKPTPDDRDQRRGALFNKEMLKALKIIDEGHAKPQDLRGSWAGAMGQNQFMPSSFYRFAHDHDGDGKADIWNNLADVFASSANYLNQSGWVEGQRWGRPVHLPKGFNPDLIGLKPHQGRLVSEWKKQGLTTPSGNELPETNGRAWLVRPEDKGQDAYLVYSNYRVLMDWNRSTYFATAVGLLADRIAAARREP